MDFIELNSAGNPAASSRSAPVAKIKAMQVTRDSSMHLRIEFIACQEYSGGRRLSVELFG